MDLEQQLRVALAPCEPGPQPLALVMAELSAPGTRASRGKRRGRGPTILVGTTLVIVAAAALLGWRLRVSPEPQASVASAPSVPPPPAPVAVVIESTPAAVLPVRQPALKPAPKPEPAVPALKPFAVLVVWQDKTTDEAAQSAVAVFHAAFLDRLRVIPGLTLLAPDAIGVAADAAGNYRVTITVEGPRAQNTLGARLVAERAMLVAEGAPPSRSMSGASVSIGIAPTCVTPPAADLSTLVSDLSCNDPVTTAAYLVGLLRKTLFPLDPSLLRQLQAQLLDQRLDPRQRMSTLGDLFTLKRKISEQDSAVDAGLRAQLDAAFVRGAIDLAATATDPAVRAQIWRTVRGIRSADLVQPLIAASSQDSDGEVRLEAISTLAVDFVGDQRVRTALQTLARGDARPLVRAVAQRALSGDASWQQYVADSLKDGSRTDAERIEALVHDVFDRHLPGSVSRNPERLRALLDDGGTRALAQVLPRLRPTAQLTGAVLGQLAADVSAIDHPAVTEMLLDSLRNGNSAGPVSGAMAVRPLLDHSDDARIGAALRESPDPRVRIQLELIRTSDPDPKRREMAARLLTAAPVPATP